MTSYTTTCFGFAVISPDGILMDIFGGFDADAPFRTFISEGEALAAAGDDNDALPIEIVAEAKGAGRYHPALETAA